LKGASPELLKQLFLVDEADVVLGNKALEYLKHSIDNHKVKPIQDDVRFKDLCSTLMNTLEFKEDELMAIWKILAAILHIGNVTVDGSSFMEGKCKFIYEDNSSLYY